MKQWLLALLILTGADGKPVWIETENVVTIASTTERESVQEAQTRITMMNGTIYVREPPEIVAHLLGWVDQNETKK